MAWIIWKAKVAACSVYRLLLQYKFLTPPVHDEISIHITSISCMSCLQCSVNRSYNSNKWVAVTRAGWCVVRVVDYLACSVKYVVFSQVSAATLFGLGWRVYNFLIRKFLTILHNKWCVKRSKPNFFFVERFVLCHTRFKFIDSTVVFIVVFVFIFASYFRLFFSGIMHVCVTRIKIFIQARLMRIACR